MLRHRIAFAACVLVVALQPAIAAPGDVFVPAHRTRDGSYVPPNVAPLSGGTYMARRPTRGATNAVARRDFTRSIAKRERAGS